MKFYCEDCGKLYQKCKCVVYMSRYRFGRTDPPSPYPKATKNVKNTALWSRNGHPDES